MRYRGIDFGRATVPVHEDGGWALPNYGRTHCADTALEVAIALDAEIAALEAKRKPEKPAAARLITRRRVGEKAVDGLPLNQPRVVLGVDPDRSTGEKPGALSLIDCDDQPSCHHCGSDNLAYLARYANGDAWECRDRGEEIMHQPTDEP